MPKGWIPSSFSGDVQRIQSLQIAVPMGDTLKHMPILISYAREDESERESFIAISRMQG